MTHAGHDPHAGHEMSAGHDMHDMHDMHGGHGEIVLIVEERALPAQILDVTSFYGDLMRGRYGPVVEATRGPGHNDFEIPVQWNLRRHRGKKLRILSFRAVCTWR